MSERNLSAEQIQKVVATLEAAGFPNVSFIREHEGLIPDNSGAILARRSIPSNHQHRLLTAFVPESSWAQVQAELLDKHHYIDVSPKDGSMRVLHRNQSNGSFGVGPTG